MKFGIRATHIRGVNNLAGDALFQGNILLFGSCCQQGDLDQTQIPVEILNVTEGTRFGGEGLDKYVDFYFDCALARSTLKGYSSTRKCYQLVCILYPLPVSEQPLCRYVAQWLSSLIEGMVICYGRQLRCAFSGFSG